MPPAAEFGFLVLDRETGGQTEGDRLSHDELRNLVLNSLVGGVDTSQSQLAHAIRLLACAPEQWEPLRGDLAASRWPRSTRRCAASRSRRSPRGHDPRN